ncbi:MAG TPA: glycoside hydrolase domain-containing protein [archaeon]|nr:glycoside hydrolase domain-containing protein [archaeon]
MAKKYLILCLALFSANVFPGCAGPRGKTDLKKSNFQAWPANIEVRTCPGAFSREPNLRKIELEGLAGEVLSAQVVVRHTDLIKSLAGEMSDLTGPAGKTVPPSLARVRYGAYLPVDETMALTADPLLEASSVDVPANTAQPVWLTIKLPPDSPAGTYNGKLTISASSGQKEVFDLSVEVLPAVLAEPNKWKFYLNIWQDPSGVARAHKVKPWSEEHWALLERYAENFVAHGMDVITTSIVYDPWGSQTGYPYEAMVEWKYPGEFKKGAADRFNWDFSVFDRYVSLMMDAGMTEKIDCFSMVEGPWININADIRYLDTASSQYRTIDIILGDPVWREVWSAFLPVFRNHLKEKGWFDRAFLAFDEKPEKEMQVIYEFLIRQAPDFKVSIAGGYPGDQRKTSDEVIFHYNDLNTEAGLAAHKPLIEKMRAEGRYISFYTACTPHYPNVFLFSQLREARLLPWLSWKWGLSGYLRWAVAAFPEDVWTQPNYKWHSGDMYFVYPGENGPLDGMRWELFRQGVEDCEALRIAREMAESAGREDLLKRLRGAVEEGTVTESCDRIPFVGEARATVNQVIRVLGRQK